MKQDELKVHAANAAEKFATEDVSLNDSVLKIAQENDLNIEQVKRLCEIANQIVQLSLFPVNPLVQFDLADSSKVISSLNQENGVEAKPDFISPSPVSTDLLDEYMKKCGPAEATEEDSKPKITIISIRKISQQLRDEDKRLNKEQMKLAREAEELDLSMRRMVKIAMVKGNYPAFLRAGWELDGKNGMRYVMDKIAFWKKNYISCRASKSANEGELNESHPFVKSFRKLAEINKRMAEIGIAKRRMRSIADKVVEAAKDSGKIIKSEDIVKRPLQQTYKAE